ncbi:MAG: class I SAM-dependent methyltransferase [Elusimicrobia bacterium]|nr:class I SAM-dependent methyltransferase [Elusimicrobiota bacterium]
MSRSLYADPALYDLLHAEGTDDEVWFLERLALAHGNGGRRALEPACGTGRYLEGLLRRGWSVFGYDLSPAMRAFARARLARFGARARIVRGDMRSFRSAERFDMAFSLLSTFRHLETDREARAFLRATAAALAPGGILVLGLDLADYVETEADEETWTVRRGAKTWRQVQLVLPPERRGRRERILNFVTGPDGKVLRFAHDLRAYDAKELSALLKRAGLRVEAVYGADGKPARLGGPERSLWLVLKPA